jgi:thiol:disulfide interchange protein DsbD
MLLMILYSFVGGLILNLMPCVFPVLALKAFGFIRTAGEDKSARLLHVGAYTLGIVGTMVAFAGLIAIIRYSGGVVGWGFQFQHPPFIIFMCALLFLFALNLLGVFEISIPGMQTGIKDEQSLGGSVFEGFLAVVLATPCSAPFVGSAVGFALTQGLLEIFVIFAALGLGLAAPFAALAMIPGLAEKLPRPGNWMLRLKELLSFALFGTMVWMIWVLGRATGTSTVIQTLILLLGLSLLAWAFGHWQKGSFGVKGFSATLLFAAGVVWAGQAQVPPDAPQQGATTAAVASADSHGITWVPFNPEAVQAKLKEGQPVFVDFTADWCITCKVNERTIIETEDVVAVMKRLNVATFKGDYTKPDDVITATLQEYGKGGVPMYLVFSPKNPKRAEVLPEVFTKTLLNEALQRAAN